MLLSKKSLFSLMLAATFCSGAQADVLFSRLPTTNSLDGIQADASNGDAYLQSIPVLAGATLDKIVWWGYHGSNSLGASYDAFEVSLGGSVVTGTLSTSGESANQSLIRYVLDITDQPVNFSELKIWNNSDYVEWFWQLAFDQTGANSSGDSYVAFQLEGVRTPVNPLPEPGFLGLLGLAALAAARLARKYS